MEEEKAVFLDITLYDCIIAVILVFLLVKGIRAGFLRQGIGLLSLFLVYFVASRHIDILLPLLRKITSSPESALVAGYAVMFFMCYCLVIVGGRIFILIVRRIPSTGIFNRLGGGLVGILKALLVVVFLQIFLGAILSRENTAITTCVACSYLAKTANNLSTLVKDEKFRKLFGQQKLALPVDSGKGNLIRTPDPRKSGPEQSRRER